MKAGDKVSVKHPNTDKDNKLDFKGEVTLIGVKSINIIDQNGIERICNKETFKIEAV